VPIDNAMRVGKIHKFFGYAILLISNVACLTGVYVYTSQKLQNDKATPILIITLPLFALLVLICEINLRAVNAIKALKFESKKTLPTYTMEQIDAMIAAKREIVIIDNLVLDVHEYDGIHPGGKFVFQNNIGRDISKFFYGGYVMVNGPGAEKPHQHSYNALKIAKDMVIGVLKGQE